MAQNPFLDTFMPGFHVHIHHIQKLCPVVPILPKSYIVYIDQTVGYEVPGRGIGHWIDRKRAVIVYGECFSSYRRLVVVGVVKKLWVG